MRTGKKAGLKCLERCPLGSGNADEEEILVDETNNTDYEETVDPVSDDIATEEVLDFISGTELETCTKGEEQLISKDTAADIAADRSPEADVKILEGAFVIQMLSLRTSNTFHHCHHHLGINLPFAFLRTVEGETMIVVSARDVIFLVGSTSSAISESGTQIEIIRIYYDAIYHTGRRIRRHYDVI